jgi:hypothetical protein
MLSMTSKLFSQTPSKNTALCIQGKDIQVDICKMRFELVYLVSFIFFFKQ